MERKVPGNLRVIMLKPRRRGGWRSRMKARRRARLCPHTLLRAFLPFPSGARECSPGSCGFSHRTRGHQPPSDSSDFQRTPTQSHHDTTSQRGHVNSSFIYILKKKKSSLRGTGRNGPATSLNLLWLLSSPPPPLSTSLCSAPLSLPTLHPHISSSLPSCGAQKSENSP